MEEKSLRWVQSHESQISSIQDSLAKLLDLNIADEIAAHEAKKTIAELNAEYKSLGRELRGYTSEQRTVAASIAEINKNLSVTDSGVCPTCSQSINSDKHEQMHAEYASRLTDLASAMELNNRKIAETTQLMQDIEGMIPAEPTTYYSTLSQAYNHKTELDTLGNKLSGLLESANPYLEQIEMLRATGLQEISFDNINNLTRVKEHQDFLLKMLTNKDSFIRKKIIDQNIAFLNTRLSHYLTEVGLPHTVKFLSDLEVEITQYGKEFDFDNLSRGERTRLVLSLSWAFRDVFESLYGKINLMFIDELVDQGLDSAGAESVLRVLKSMTRGTGKTVYLISHKEEYIARIDNVLKVVKENNFTTFEVGITA
jgi:DNA repair exonuclease SbcCD ATPase subunit